jgi:hypothetical protein
VTPLRELQDSIGRALGDRLLGLYAFGSLVIGDFDPGRSDLDLLAVLPSRVTDAELARLHALHADLVRAHPDWTDRIETAYFPLDVLRDFQTRGGEVVRISPGEPLHRVTTSPHWLLDLYTVQEKGLVLHGPPAAALLPPITRDEFVAAARANLRDWPGWLAESRAEGFQSYAVLAVCRNLHAVVEGTQVSKPYGARWAAARYPRFAALIEQSLHRLGSTTVDEATCTASQEFVRFAGTVGHRADV